MIPGFRDETARVRGLAFHWLEWGADAAPPLVLLHGLTGHAHTWDHMAPDLAAQYHVIALDQRGHGDTEHAETYRTQDFVDDLEALAGAWGFERFALMGLSMGAHNAMAFAAAHPQRVSNLVVIDIPAKMDRSKAPNWDVISRLADTGHRTYTSFEQAFADYWRAMEELGYGQIALLLPTKPRDDSLCLLDQYAEEVSRYRG